MQRCSTFCSLERLHDWQRPRFFETSDADEAATGPDPTYVYPEDLRLMVRMRFRDPDSGNRDAEFARREGALHVTWEDLAAAKWPKPPKACRSCGGAQKKPY